LRTRSGYIEKSNFNPAYRKAPKNNGTYWKVNREMPKKGKEKDQ